MSVTQVQGNVFDVANSFDASKVHVQLTCGVHVRMRHPLALVRFSLHKLMFERSLCRKMPVEFLWHSGIQIPSISVRRELLKWINACLLDQSTRVSKVWKRCSCRFQSCWVCTWRALSSIFASTSLTTYRCCNMRPHPIRRNWSPSCVLDSTDRFIDFKNLGSDGSWSRISNNAHLQFPT